MPVSSHPAAVHAMKSLKTKYRAMKRDYPTLESIVIACPDRDSRDAADRVACRAFAFRLVGRSLHPDNATQWLIDDDPCRGLQAFEASWKLARRSVKCLADLRVLKPTDSPPEPLDPEQLKHHFFARWTWFVHQLAQTRPGSDLWSCESKSIALHPPYKSQPIDHLPLKDGAVCWTLSVPIFEASALALERVLSGFQSDPAAKTAPQSNDPPTPPGTTAGTQREPNNARGTRKGRQGRKRDPLTPMEDEVWRLYQEHEGEHSPFYEVVEILKPKYPDLKAGRVQKIVRKVKARGRRDNEASRTPGTKNPVKRG